MINYPKYSKIYGTLASFLPGSALGDGELVGDGVLVAACIFKSYSERKAIGIISIDSVSIWNPTNEQ